MVDVILGLQWGDEGKGKIVDFFAPHYDVIARFQGGPNAGHTLYVDGKKVVLHQIPSGIFHQNCVNLIANGVVLDPVTLKRECETVASFGIDVKKNLFISEKTNLIIPTHRALDKASELQKGEGKIGSTLKGIGPAYMDKTGRNAIRVGDLLSKNFTTQYIKLRLKHQKLLDNFHFIEDITAWEEEFFEAIDFLKTLNIVNGEYFINNKLNEGKKVLAEGAQGTMLDIDFGTFPYVTSSNTISAGVCTGLGVSPQKINDVIGVTKAYCTRVGSGPFPTELHDSVGDELRKIGNEFGATTGRPRRCGWIDLVALKYTCMLNGVTKVVMTKADVLDTFENLQVCTSYTIEGKTTQEIPYQISKVAIDPTYQTFKGWNCDSTKINSATNLPANMVTYIKFINEFIGAPVKYVSNGPGREQIIVI
ncbi:MAG TPA: adenylosuccinate synthase [Chitinophagaceae bacterium]|nr:adenylosuccinate synthase [Chitinophagaceae bacterium]HNF28734.1 adenylosuccinate synthase [Chitinophagaceae bacterium]HNM33288.1 adenylosuccinate synthase [Chitinophagaceae bacterium]HNN31494.1 adenylosuccinate synthase [Chitinophagaceae bacterium]